MIEYLTNDHKRLPEFIKVNDMLYQSDYIINNYNENQLASQFNIYKHLTEDGSAPLGYSDWILNGDIYERSILGTVEEIAQKELEDKRNGMRCSSLQGLLAIDHFGLTTAFEEWINSSSRTFVEKSFFDKAQYWDRNNFVLVAGAISLGLSDELLDQLFEYAVNL